MMNTINRKTEAKGADVRREKARRLPLRQRRALAQALALATQAERIMGNRAYRLNLNLGR